eukprot:COSAG03_NODE_769_length_5929_cov_381.464666_5_plen_140_part_00
MCVSLCLCVTRMRIVRNRYASTMPGCTSEQVSRWFAQRRVRTMRTTHVAAAGSAGMRAAAYSRQPDPSTPDAGAGLSAGLGGAVAGAAKAAFSLGNAATQPMLQRAKSNASAMMAASIDMMQVRSAKLTVSFSQSSYIS